MARASREFAQSSLRLERAARAYVDCVHQMQDVALPVPAESVWPCAESSVASRLLVSSTYKLFRVRYLLRNYGARHTLRRIRDELRTAAHLETT